MSSFGIAVIGVGDVAQRDYLPAFHRLGDSARLVVVSSRDANRARDVADRFGRPDWTTDWHAAVARPDVDIVVNLTPIPAHAEVTVAAIEAGKHVYSEKPLALDRASAERIGQAAYSRGVTVVAAPSILLFPQVRAAGRILADGSIGDVVSVRAHLSTGVPPWDGYISDPSPFFAAGGGPLRDMGVYALHAVTGLLGPVRAVTAMSRLTRSSFETSDGPAAGRTIAVEVDDDVHLLARLATGVIVSLYANFSIRGSASPELEILGSGGGLSLSLLDVSAPIRVLTSDATEWSEIPVEFERPEGGPDHVLGVAHLIECVQAQRAPILSVEHATHVIDVMDAVDLSSRNGVTTTVESTFAWPIDSAPQPLWR